MTNAMKKDIRDAIEFLTNYDYNRVDEGEVKRLLDTAVKAVAKIVDARKGN
jgi:hypothetical protein